MSIASEKSISPEITYPDSDGLPMADNTLQFEWIVKLKGGLDVLFMDNPDVFVAGDLLWYPVEGRPDIRCAPDAMVALGRPKGHRGSYKQWLENDIAPQAVFEVLSPGNTAAEMADKQKFYNRHGVLEYYLYDPDTNKLRGWLRAGRQLREIACLAGWTSPKLGIRFEIAADELTIYRPDGRRFATYVELDRQRQRAEQEHQRAKQEHQRAKQERQHAEQERQHAEQEHQRAKQEHRQHAKQESQRAERLSAQLRALGIEPEG